MTDSPAKRKHIRTGQPKGHWPRGKRRSPKPTVAYLAALRRAIDQRGLRPTARLLGADPRTVSRWASGERYPSQADAERIRDLHITHPVLV